MPHTAVAGDDEGPGILPRVPEASERTAEAQVEAPTVILNVLAFRVLRKITHDIGRSIERALDGDVARTPIGFAQASREQEPLDTFICALARSVQVLQSFVRDERLAYPGGYEARLCGVNILGAVEDFYRQLKYAGGHDATLRSDSETQSAAVHLRSAMLGASIRLEALEHGYMPQEGLVS